MINNVHKKICEYKSRNNSAQIVFYLLIIYIYSVYIATNTELNNSYFRFKIALEYIYWKESLDTLPSALRLRQK